jgi:DNA-directed RNA polymerase specialized sigma24 family protein
VLRTGGENVDETELLERFRSWLHKRARLLLSEHEGRHVDDLAAEGWIAIWREVRKTSRVDPPWLQAVAHNRMRVWIRDTLAAKTRGVRNETYVEDLAEVWEGAYALGEVELAYHRGQVLAALQKLTQRQREYVWLRFWGGWGAGELNARFRTQNSGSIWTAAKAHLERELAALGPGPVVVEQRVRPTGKSPSWRLEMTEEERVEHRRRKRRESAARISPEQREAKKAYLREYRARKKAEVG